MPLLLHHYYNTGALHAAYDDDVEDRWLLVDELLAQLPQYMRLQLSVHLPAVAHGSVVKGE